MNKIKLKKPMKKIDKPLALPIKKIVRESERVKTFIFDYDFPGKPGQFVMCWVPGFDEKPFGIIKKEGEGFSISVAAVGDTTKALHMMDVGDLLGFRGPYGSHFKLPEKGSIALIAGGYGMAPLSYLAQEARKINLEVYLFVGARKKEELLYMDWMKEIGVKVHTATDDGSYGYSGFNTELFKIYVEKMIFGKVFIVGPEIMEFNATQICYEKNIPFEVSLERYMKCGFGLCGQCCVDSTGWRMCVEGPVLNQDELKKVTEFGKYHITSSGKIKKL
jgi:dihydroorotate dehydrogenase electron transfer subunit